MCSKYIINHNGESQNQTAHRFGHPEFTAAEVLAAIEGSRGIVSTIAARLGVKRSMARSLINRWADTRVAVFEEREGIVDIAERKLVSRLIRNDWNAVKYVLDTLGKSRGYGRESTGLPHDPVDRALAEETVNWRDMIPADISPSELEAAFIAMMKEAAGESVEAEFSVVVEDSSEH